MYRVCRQGRALARKTSAICFECLVALLSLHHPPTAVQPVMLLLVFISFQLMQSLAWRYLPRALVCRYLIAAISNSSIVVAALGALQQCVSDPESQALLSVA